MKAAAIAVFKGFTNLKAWLFGIIFALPYVNLIGNFFVAGYCNRLASDHLQGINSALEWHKAGNRLLVDGIKLFLINLIYLLPAAIVFLLGMSIGSDTVNVSFKESPNIQATATLISLGVPGITAGLAAFYAGGNKLIISILDEKFYAGAAALPSSASPLILFEVGRFSTTTNIALLLFALAGILVFLWLLFSTSAFLIFAKNSRMFNSLNLLQILGLAFRPSLLAKSFVMFMFAAAVFFAVSVATSLILPGQHLAIQAVLAFFIFPVSVGFYGLVSLSSRK